MAQEANESSAGEMMVFGLIEQADRIGKSALSTQRALVEQLDELKQLQQWTVTSVQNLQQRAETAIKNLEAERGRLQGTQVNLERNAVQAIHDAVRKQSGEIERQTVNALAAPLSNIQQAAAQVRQNIKDSNWLFIGSVFLLGVVGGLLFGYFFVLRTQNTMDDRLDRIEQSLSAPSQSVPASPDPHVPGHKGKAK
jgi:ElaB/YqjD/DUF883 family membrane-anchored ribosome-binding protein